MFPDDAAEIAAVHLGLTRRLAHVAAGSFQHFVDVGRLELLHRLHLGLTEGQIQKEGRRDQRRDGIHYRLQVGIQRALLLPILILLFCTSKTQ